MKKHIVLIISLFFTIGSVWAQSYSVNGVVTDDSNETLPGVNIVVKGTDLGSVTDLDGRYSIKAKKGDILVFSFIGFKNKDVKIDREKINVVLKIDAINLDEFITIGYGNVRKRDITSSITSIDGAELAKAPTRGNFTQSLQGMAAGVQVFNTDGSPGSTPTVIIRGATSINGDPNPMYVVDGIPIGKNVNQINAQDIESVEILKDASATAIYGTQAANGVVLITTKKGKMGEQNIHVEVSYGLQNLKKPGIASAKEYMLVQNEKRFNAGQGEYALFSQDDISNAKTTDWWDEAMRSLAPVYSMNVGFNGGSKKFRYNINAGYFTQESQMVVGNWDRFTLRVNTEYHFNDNVKFGMNFTPRVETWKNTPSIWDNISMDPTTPVYRPEDEQIGLNRYSVFQRSYNNDIWNPMGNIERFKVNNDNLQVGLSTNTYLNIRFLKDLIFNSQLGLDFSSLMQDGYDPEFVIDLGKESNLVNSVSRQVNNYYSFVWNNTLSYVKTFKDKHNLNLMAGVVAEKGKTKDLWGYKKNIPNDSEFLRYLSAATQEPDASGNDVINTALFSVLGRVMYNYDEKYYVNVSVRRDGSFKFPEKNRYATFPAVSVAWAMHNENFIKDNVSWISLMKVKGGWGQVGNQGALDANVFLTTLAKIAYVYGVDPQTLVGVYPDQIANSEIKWETVEDFSGTIDLGFLNNSITFTGAIFSKRTKDMIMLKSYPFYSGYPNFEAMVWSNIGSIRSNGYELTFGYNNHKRDFKWNVNLNITHIKTVADKLADGLPYYDGWWGDYTTKTEEGELVGQFWGYKSEGLFQNQTDINSHTDENGKLLQPYAKPGDVRFVDVNKDGIIDEEDKTYIGSGQPDFTAGLNFAASYKGFDLSLGLYASVGAEIFNTTKWEWGWGANNSNTFSGVYEEAWHGEGTSNTTPILDLNDYNQNYDKISDIYVDNGDFLKIRNIQLGYTFGNIRKVKNFRVYINIDNPFVFTSYKALDPELFGWVTTQNIDWGDNYYNPIVYSLGLNFKF